MKPIKVWLIRASEYNLSQDDIALMIAFKKPIGSTYFRGVPVEDRFFPCNSEANIIKRLFGKLPNINETIEGTLEFRRKR